MLDWGIQIKNDPLVKADPNMLPKVKTEKYWGDRQQTGLKIKESQMIFLNEMLTLTEVTNETSKRTKFIKRTSAWQLHETWFGSFKLFFKNEK